MDFLERYETLKPKILEVERLWLEELKRHKHVLSISSSIATACGWEAKKIRDYCLSLGFNGAEIRFQGFENPLALTSLTKDKDFLLTAHLSDFAHWLYSNEQIQGLMTNQERRAYFGNANHREAIKECFLRELKWANELGINNVTFHAGQIEFLGVFGKGFYFSDEQVLERVRRFLLELLPSSVFKKRIGLENDGPYSRGMRLPEHFEMLLSAIVKPNIGLTLDIAHFAAHSLDLATTPEMVKKVWVVHLSEPSLNHCPSISDEQLIEARNQGFAAFRSLVGQVISRKDVHNPVGWCIKDAKVRLDGIYQVNPALIVVHEIKVPISEMKKACILQQAELVSNK